MYTFLTQKMKISYGSLFAACVMACLCLVVFFAPAVFAQEEGTNMEQVAGDAMQYQAGAEQGSAEYETVIEMGLGFIGNFLLNVASIFTFVGGMLLEGAIHFYVVNMVESAPLPVINAVWAVVRDICNLLFVFGFLYLGFQMIFDPHSAEAKRTLSHIIIGALLVNFSLFFVKVIIDVGNYITVSIYNAGTAAVGGASIPAAIVQALGISAFWGTGGTGVGNTDPAVISNLDGWGGVAYYFMAAIFLIVCAFVFTIAALMLVTRFVTLIMILMASPLLFAGTAFPQAQHFVQEMWQKLVTSSLFPTVFLFMMFVSVKILDFLKTGIPGAGDNKAAALQGSVTFLPVVIFFCGSIFILLQALQVSRKIAEGGHDAISHLTQHAHDSFRGFVLRNTAGRAGRAAHHSYEAFAAKNTSKDAGFVRRNFQKVLDITPIDRTLRHTLHSAETENFGSHYSLADLEKDNKERDAHRTKHQQEHATEHAIEHSVEHPLDPDLKIAMEKAIANSSAEQLLTLIKDMRDKPEKDAQYKALIGSMTHSQFESLLKSKTEDFDDGQKEKVRALRQETVASRLVETENAKRKAVAAGGGTPFAAASLDDVIGKASGADLDALDFDRTVKPNAGRLSTKQIDDMKNLTPTQKAVLKGERENALVNIFNGPNGPTEIFKRFKSAEEIAKLPIRILTHANSVDYLSPDILTKALNNDGLGSAERSAIKANIINAYGVPPGAPADAGPTNPNKFNSFDNYFHSAAGANYV